MGSQDVRSPRVAIIATSHDRFGETGRASGVWLEEFAAPYYVFEDGGCAVTLATIAGGAAPIDPTSREDAWRTSATRRFEHDGLAQARLGETSAIAELRPDDFDLAFLPGGFGAMWDFPAHRPLADFLQRFVDEEKPIATVCHAAAALLPLRERDGRPFVDGRLLTCFSDSEEGAVGADGIVPFLLETALRRQGARPACGPDWEEKVCIDGRLVTGQNPASARATAATLLALWRGLGDDGC